MNAILAEMVNAKFDTADLFFFVAAILLAIAALLAAMANAVYTYDGPPGVERPVRAPHPVTRWAVPTAYLGLAFAALGLWVL